MARFLRSYGKVKYGKPPYFGPFPIQISGQVTLGGVPQMGAIVYLIDETTDTLVGMKTTDASGNYAFTSADNIYPTHTYHVAVEYDDGAGNKYNSESLPYITPVNI